MNSDPPFYPAEALDAHGVPPDDWNGAGCYALALDTPATPRAFVDRWDEHYDVNPPEALLGAVIDRQLLVYVGAASSLRKRLEDHAQGERRQAGLLAVCPPVAVREVWPEASAEMAFERERQHAYELRDRSTGIAVYCDGEVV